MHLASQQRQAFNRRYTPIYTNLLRVASALLQNLNMHARPLIYILRLVNIFESIDLCEHE